jgi:glutamate-1-semialdehyde 2,1-aminomutase
MPEHPLIEKYRAFAPTSATLAARAQKVFPGGDTRSSAHFAPYPLSIDHASGCELTDVDGNLVLDFMNNFTSLIHGHAHPAVVEAVQTQVAQGSAYAATNVAQIELAELIASRVASIELLRFTSSGTEGTQMAIRCARAATGRTKIIKMEGGYHGSYEAAEVSLVPLPAQRGDLHAPASLPVDDSFPASVLNDVIVCPYNQPEMATLLIANHADDLAAVIVEPVLGSMGMVSADREFLQALRHATEQASALLIFDEVITLRLASGGAQSTHGIIPDLTCMGKIIGGGLPVGGIGGRADLMNLFSPAAARPVMHASTFSGNALTMAAGLAAMRHYSSAEAERLNDLGEALRLGFNRAFVQSGIKACAVGQGSLSNILFTDTPPRDARDALDSMLAAGHISSLLHLTMLRHGITSAARLMYCISTPMDASHIERAITALHESLAELRPYIEQERPGLLAA